MHCENIHIQLAFHKENIIHRWDLSSHDLKMCAQLTDGYFFSSAN